MNEKLNIEEYREVIKFINNLEAFHERMQLMKYDLYIGSEEAKKDLVFSEIYQFKELVKNVGLTLNVNQYKEM